MADQSILIIRHAEKPDHNNETRGVDNDGQPDKRSLTPRGWQRAGGWVQMFAPALGQLRVLPRPQAIFASAPEEVLQADVSGSKSRRPLETVTPLAARLGLDVNLEFTKGQEEGLAQACAQLYGVSLLCWQHENIAQICAALRPAPAAVPTTWPDERFNVIFELNRSSRDARWSFRQRIPQMLDGDSADPIEDS